MMDERPTPMSHAVLTPDSHIKMTLTRFGAVIGGVAIAVGTALGAYTTVTKQLEAHLKDDDRHLDPAYQKDHGRPVGKWDVDVWKTELTERLDKMQASFDASIREVKAEHVKHR